MLIFGGVNSRRLKRWDLQSWKNSVSWDDKFQPIPRSRRFSETKNLRQKRERESFKPSKRKKIKGSLESHPRKIEGNVISSKSKIRFSNLVFIWFFKCYLRWKKKQKMEKSCAKTTTWPKIKNTRHPWFTPTEDVKIPLPPTTWRIIPVIK